VALFCGLHCSGSLKIQKQKLWLKYRNIRDIPATIAANATSGTMCTKIRDPETEIMVKI
jgi:hypothetical protein